MDKTYAFRTKSERRKASLELSCQKKYFLRAKIPGENQQQYQQAHHFHPDHVEMECQMSTRFANTNS